MSRSLTEEQVLRKLNITDFRHMTKDKVKNFVAMFPKMDPEVAKRALEQFPNLAETSRSIVSCIKDSLKTIVSSNAENMASFNARCQEALAILDAELKREDLTDEGRKIVIDGITDIIEIISQKDSENKAFHRELFHGVLWVCTVVALGLMASLGLRAHSSLNR